MRLDDHPTVRSFHEREATRPPAQRMNLDAAWLKQLCLEAGADDVGVVEIGRPALDEQRDDILRFFPAAKTLVSFVCRMNREPIRSTARSVSNLEFHHAGEAANEVARRIVAAFERLGVARGQSVDGLSDGDGPVPRARSGWYRTSRSPWQPGWGASAFIATSSTRDSATSFCSTRCCSTPRSTAYDQPIDYNPCLECKLCVAACPVGSDCVGRRASTSRPATRTTTASSWVGLRIGSRRSPTAEMRSITGGR